MRWYQYAKVLVFFSAVFVCKPVSGQTWFGEGPINWESKKPYVVSTEALRYKDYDLVVLEEATEFHFYGTNNEKVVRSAKFLINTKRGADILKDFRTPESFDIASDECLSVQGRRARIKIPFLQDYQLVTFAARKFANGHWANISVKDHYETYHWIKSTGEFVNDEEIIMHMGGLMPGDVVEIYYAAGFNAEYGSNLFYFNSRWPKLKCEYDFIYKVDNRLDSVNFIKAVNIPDWQIKESRMKYDTYTIKTKQIKLDYLPGITYPVNSMPANKLPHVKADFNFYRQVLTLSQAGSHIKNTAIKAGNFQWVTSTDTSVKDYTKFYDKQFQSIRKFTSSLPKPGNDSQNVVFFKALCDTFNAFRFITANHLFYNESQIYEVYSGDHILKRRLPSQHMGKLYVDILYDNRIFFYSVNVLDRRLGEHDPKYRAHQGYEQHLFALPSGNSYIYFMPRRNGIKYHLNELPFYHEGSLAVLTPANFQPGTTNKQSKLFKVIRLHKGTSNENSRSESATVYVNPDSALARLNIKESLTGQFSTVLRHLYLNECIDSTISPHYFRKCTDKPQAQNVSIKASAKGTDYPFRYNFNCSEKLKLQRTDTLGLHNWFSFTLNKALIYRAPEHDYYFDFEFSDYYNYQISLSPKYTLGNTEGFTRNISNDFFDLESSITTADTGTYLLKVKFVVKQESIPVTKSQMLMQLLEELERISNYKLALVKN